MTLAPIAQQLTVHEFPSAQNGGRQLTWGSFYRGPILPDCGSRERERALRQYWHHDYNTLFRGAIAGLVKRVQSTPWEVKAPRYWGDYWQRFLFDADFGDWDRFLSKLITDYSRHDQGAWIEIIAPGSPNEAPIAPAVGLSVLDSVRVLPTGDPEYPVLYYDIKGRLHTLHQSRVLQFADGIETEEDIPGYGDCALARCIAPVKRQILMGRFIEMMLDDSPAPGILTLSNISDAQFKIAVKEYIEKRQADKSLFGQLLILYGMGAEEDVKVTHTTYASPPEKFDFEQYTTLDVRQIALGIGLDIQDIWELTGGGIGTGTQSQIMAQKSRGKAFGRILKSLERTFNRLLPEEVEFSWQYRDPQEDLEEAQKAQTWGSTVQALTIDLTAEERRRLLANQIPAFADVLLDEAGNIRRLGDQDIEPESATLTDTDTDTPELANESIAPLFIETQQRSKALGPDAVYDLARPFRALLRQADGGVHPNTLRAQLRGDLRRIGKEYYDQGYAEGGGNLDERDAEGEALARERVSEWVSSQSDYITKLVKDMRKTDMDALAATDRALLWVNRAGRSIWAVGKADAAPNVPHRWKLNPQKENCETCQMLNGQIHAMKIWGKSGFTPGSSTLKCKGFECGCDLVPMPGARSLGTLPTHTIRNDPSIVDRMANFMRGLFGRHT